MKNPRYLTLSQDNDSEHIATIIFDGTVADRIRAALEGHYDAEIFKLEIDIEQLNKGKYCYPFQITYEVEDVQFSAELQETFLY